MFVSGFSCASKTPDCSAVGSSAKVSGAGLACSALKIEMVMSSGGVRILTPLRSAGVVIDLDRWLTWRMPLSQRPSSFSPAACARSSIMPLMSPSIADQAAGASGNRNGRPITFSSGTICAVAPWLFAVIWITLAEVEVSASTSSPIVAAPATLTVMSPLLHAATFSAKKSAASERGFPGGCAWAKITVSA